MTLAVNRQRVIVYTYKGQDYIYSTAYDDDQVHTVVENCVIRRGANVQVRSRTTDPQPPRGV